MDLYISVYGGGRMEIKTSELSKKERKKSKKKKRAGVFWKARILGTYGALSIIIDSFIIMSLASNYFFKCKNT